MKNKLKNHPLVDLMFEYGSMSLPTHRSSARNFSISSPSTSTSNSKKIQADIDGEKTEVTFSNYKDNDDDEISAQISWGNESHNLVFEPHEEIDDHDTEGSEMSFIAKSEDGKWDFEILVALAYGYESGQCNPCIQDYPVLMSRFQGSGKHSGVYLYIRKDPDYEEQEEYDKGWYNEGENDEDEATFSVSYEEGTCGYGKNGKIGKKPAGPDMLQERFQKLAGIKPLYEQDSENGEIEISLEDLTFDQIVSTFTDNYQDVHFTRKQPNGEEGNYYRDGINFPNFDDSSTHIGDENAWEDWKNKTMRHYGNVNIVLKPDGKNWFDKVFIDDDKFNQDKDKFITGKMSAMQRDMDAGRSID